MIDLDKHPIDIKCPSCMFLNSVTLKQIRIHDVVICRGCKRSIQLQDHLHSTSKAVRSIRRALYQLEEQISKIGKVTLRL